MPVTWEIRDRLLILHLIGHYDYDAPINAVTDAMLDPGFQPGTMLLIDARFTGTRRSSEEFRERAIWMASLQSKGLAPRSAIVINSQPHQFGVARMAATHVEIQNMETQIFTDMDAAASWLLGSSLAESGADSAAKSAGSTA